MLEAVIEEICELHVLVIVWRIIYEFGSVVSGSHLKFISKSVIMEKYLFFWSPIPKYGLSSGVMEKGYAKIVSLRSYHIIPCDDQ